MWTLVILLSIIGFLHFIMSISLLEKKRNTIIAILAMALIPLLYHYFALQTNLKVIIAQLSNLQFVSNLVALEIGLIMLSTFFTIDIIHSHFNKNNIKIKRFFSLIPSVFLIIGISLSQLWLFNEIAGTPYFWLSIALTAVITLVASFFVFISKRLLKDWSLRLELKTLFSFLLIMAAMLLPIFFQQISIITLDQSPINFNLSLVIISAFFIVFTIGFLNYKYQITQHIWKRFIKF